jgi:hypothetical protein
MTLALLREFVLPALVERLAARARAWPAADAWFPTGGDDFAAAAAAARTWVAELRSRLASLPADGNEGNDTGGPLHAAFRALHLPVAAGDAWWAGFEAVARATEADAAVRLAALMLLPCPDLADAPPPSTAAALLFAVYERTVAGAPLHATLALVQVFLVRPQRVPRADDKHGGLRVWLRQLDKPPALVAPEKKATAKGDAVTRVATSLAQAERAGAVAEEEDEELDVDEGRWAPFRTRGGPGSGLVYVCTGVTSHRLYSEAAAIPPQACFYVKDD